MSETQKKLSLFALTWPIFIEICLHMLMGNADTFMLSQYSDNAVASVGVANQVLNMVVVMFGFVAMGTGIVVAQHLGAGQPRKASEVAVVAMVTNLIFGGLLSLALLGFGESILRAMNLPLELMGDAKLYLGLVGGFVFIEAIMLAASATVRSHGFTKDAMYVTIGMNVLNVIGNYLFIFGPFGIPVLGVAGVALSTVVARGLGLVAMFVILYKRVGNLPFRCLLSFPTDALKSILRIGVPSAGENLAYSVSQMMITYIISGLGAQALTTKVYAQNIGMFIFLGSFAIAQATQIMVGHMTGARDYENAYRTCMRSLRIALGTAVGVAVLFALFRSQLLGIFTDDPAIIAMGGSLILLTLVLEPGRTFNLVIISSLKAAGDARFPVYMGILSMFGIAVTLSYLLGITAGLGLVGVWIAFAADEWFRGLFMLWRWRTRKWQKMSLIDKIDTKKATLQA